MQRGLLRHQGEPQPRPAGAPGRIRAVEPLEHPLGHLRREPGPFVGHLHHGLWTHPRDRSTDYNTLPYWTRLAQTLERALQEAGGNAPEVLARTDASVAALERAIEAANDFMTSRGTQT